jgi:hypothetical protein
LTERPPQLADAGNPAARREPRPRTKRVLAVAGALIAVLAIVGLWTFWNAWRQPTYLPPRGDEIDIVLELAGVFPDNYAIMWREHMALRSTDPEAQADPALLGDALFMHKLTTGSEGKVYIEAEYRFYARDHKLAPDGTPQCSCAPQPSCHGRLAFGSYEFSLVATYKEEACTTPFDPKRQKEFDHAMQTAHQLIGIYLQPLRRKPSWL